ncbi:MAG: hypothetical protein KA419_13460 [Acidobacteria bacterium]|nr:hypothetical protein [Acidobacteriota bacterium]
MRRAFDHENLIDSGRFSGRFLPVHRHPGRLALALASLLLFAPAGLPAGGKKVRPGPPAAEGPFVPSVPFPGRNPDSLDVYNASGVAALPDGRLLFVDNNADRAVYTFTLDDRHRLTAPPRRAGFDLKGVPPADLEGLTLALAGDRPVLFGVSSLSAPKRGKVPGAAAGSLVRITVDGENISAESMPGFREWLVDSVPGLAAASGLEADAGGLNVEGLAWDPWRGTLLLGLRTPLADGRPLVLPLRVRDLAGPWTPANLEAFEPIRLDLVNAEAGMSIRGLEYDPDREGFLVLLGNAVSGGRAPFRLAFWDGSDEGRTELLPGLLFSPKVKPESVTRVRSAQGTFLLVVDDGGGFAVIPDAPAPEGP